MRQRGNKTTGLRGWLSQVNGHRNNLNGSHNLYRAPTPHNGYGVIAVAIAVAIVNFFISRQVYA